MATGTCMFVPNRWAHRGLYAAIVLALSPPAAWAQAAEPLTAQPTSPQTPSAPSIQELVSSALATHPAVRGKRSERNAAESDVEFARRQLWPTPSIGTEFVAGGHTIVARLSQPLWTGGKLTADIEYAKVLEDRAAVSIEETQNAVALRVISTYQAYLLQQARARVIREGLVKLKDLNAMIDRRIEAGVSPQADRQMSQLRLVQAESDLGFAESAIRNGAIQLAQLSRLPVSRFPTEAATFAVRVPQAPLPLDRLIDQVRQASPTLKVARLNEQAAQVQITQAKAGLMPKVSARLEHQFGNYPGSLASGSRVGLSVEYTPGAGLSYLTQINTLVARHEALAETTRAQEMELADRVSNEWHDLTSFLVRSVQLDISSGLSQATLESNERLFRRGGRTWTELLNAVREQTQTQLQREEVVISALGADYRLSVLGAAQVEAMTLEAAAK